MRRIFSANSSEETPSFFAADSTFSTTSADSFNFFPNMISFLKYSCCYDTASLHCGWRLHSKQLEYGRCEIGDMGVHRGQGTIREEYPGHKLRIDVMIAAP